MSEQTGAPAETTTAPAAPPQAEAAKPAYTGTGKTKRPTSESLRRAFMPRPEETKAEAPAKPAEVAKVEAPKTEETKPPAENDELKDRQRRDMRQSELDEREERLTKLEKELSTRERGSDLGKLRDKYVENRAEGLKELLKAWGVADDADMKDEAEDLALEIVETILGVNVEQSRKNTAVNRRIQKALKLSKADQAKREAEASDRTAAEQHKTAMHNAARTIQQQLGSADNAKKFPWLASEDDAGSLVVERWKKYNDKDGTNKHWSEVAGELNEQFASYWKTAYDSRKHLLSTSEPKQDSPVESAQESPAPGQQARQTEKSKIDPRPGKWVGAEAKRKETMAKIRQLIKEQKP